MDYIHAFHGQGQRGSVYFGWLSFLGILNILLGIAAVIFTNVSTLISVYYLGWFLIFSGLASVFLAFQLKTIGGHWSLFIFGTLAVVCGILMLAHPGRDAAILTLLVAVYLFTSGFVSLVSCFFIAFSHKPWIALSGLAAIFCAYIIYSEWPFSGTWVPGTFFGAYLFLHGVSQLQIGSAGKKLLKASAGAEAIA